MDSCKPVQCGSLAALPSSEIAVLAGTPVCAEAAGRQYGESLVMALEDRRLLLLQDALLPLGGDQGSGSAPAPRGQVLARLTVGKRVERLSVSSDRGHVMLETKDQCVSTQSPPPPPLPFTLTPSAPQPCGHLQSGHDCQQSAILPASRCGVDGWRTG